MVEKIGDWNGRDSALYVSSEESHKLLQPLNKD